MDMLGFVIGLLIVAAAVYYAVLKHREKPRPPASNRPRPTHVGDPLDDDDSVKSGNAKFVDVDKV